MSERIYIENKFTMLIITKLQFRITTILIFSVVQFLSSSCSNNTKTKVDTNTEKEILNAPTEKIEMGNFKYGKWRIDSVAENNTIIHRLTKDTIIQVFNFRKNGKFATLKVEPKHSMERVIGTWSIKKDSLFMLAPKGGIAMRYGWELNKNILILNGNFQATSTNKNKPTFYLSKFKDIW